ncbi:hypothetical protein K469DRAFT_118468 [Zopfia rhizophila CBS 207.26]|uniref:Uncharacterized protein n=1 Tax=Zopfia rhizophila CBS 207.26 TaxID=1314779 RepID=A0A6A6E4P4_9PEZI|nr:hypothetical protein K469DRAFT_118468 [Zopfia rhizophila CBS 207.26]
MWGVECVSRSQLAEALEAKMGESIEPRRSGLHICSGILGIGGELQGQYCAARNLAGRLTECGTKELYTDSALSRPSQTKCEGHKMGRSLAVRRCLSRGSWLAFSPWQRGGLRPIIVVMSELMLSGEETCGRMLEVGQTTTLRPLHLAPETLAEEDDQKRALVKRHNGGE